MTPGHASSVGIAAASHTADADVMPVGMRLLAGALAGQLDRDAALLSAGWMVLAALTFLGIYALVWLVWLALLRGTHAARRERHPRLLLSQVSAMYPVLRTYFLLVFAIFALLLRTAHLSLGLGVQTGLLLVTYLYAGQADRRRPARRARRHVARATSAERAQV